MGDEDLVKDSVTAKEDGSVVAWLHYGRLIAVDFKFATVAGLPVCVEIDDQAELAVIAVVKLVKVRIVVGPGRVFSQMEFRALQADVHGATHSQTQIVDAGEERL